MRTLFFERTVTPRRTIFLCQKEVEVLAACADVVSVLCSCELLKRFPQLFPVFHGWLQDSQRVSALFHIHRYNAQRENTHTRMDNWRSTDTQILRYICIQALPISLGEEGSAHTWDIFGATASKNAESHKLFPLQEARWEFLRCTYSKCNAK